MPGRSSVTYFTCPVEGFSCVYVSLLPSLLQAEASPGVSQARLMLACLGPFPIAPTLLAAQQYRQIVFIDLVEMTTRSSYFHPPHFPPMHDWIPIYWCMMLTFTHPPIMLIVPFILALRDAPHCTNYCARLSPCRAIPPPYQTGPARAENTQASPATIFSSVLSTALCPSSSPQHTEAPFF
jgi:hypothetical protein